MSSDTASATTSDSTASDTASDTAEQQRREDELVERVLAAYAGTPDPRLQLVMAALLRHLHGFIREVRLTESEWAAAIGFLTAAGHITTDKRQEFILLSDVLGASMQTVAVNSPAQGDATEATVFGPFFVADAPRIEIGGDIAQGAKGVPCHVSGRVVGVDGRGIAGARIEVWEADADGFYDIQYTDGPTMGRAHLFSADDGSYSFWSVKPSPYPIPTDGPVGALIRATGRHPNRPAHLHFMVSAPGHRTLVTHIFVPDSAYLDSDAVFGVKQSLVVPFTDHPPGQAPGRVLDEPWASATFQIVLAPIGHAATDTAPDPQGAPS